MNNQPQAVLPARLRERTLADLNVDESAYTVPWAMKADLDGNLWLSTHFPTRNVSGGTVQMLVTRTRNGWACDISLGCDNYRWSPGNVDVSDAVVALLIT